MFLDRWADGDPANNEANGTVWEFDVHETQVYSLSSKSSHAENFVVSSWR